MPKCRKCHAKWRVLFPNCCNTRRMLPGEKSRKTPLIKKTKTIVHPLNHHQNRCVQEVFPCQCLCTISIIRPHFAHCSSWLTDCWFVLALYNIYNPMCLASSCNYQVFLLAFSVWESPLPDLGIGSGWQTVLSIRGPLLCWNLCRWEVYSLLKCVFLARGLGHNCCLCDPVVVVVAIYVVFCFWVIVWQHPYIQHVLERYVYMFFTPKSQIPDMQAWGVLHIYIYTYTSICIVFF